MTDKFTPGPWRVIVDDDGGVLSGRPGVFAADELDCAIVHWDGFKQEYWESGRGEKEMHANATLISAAPELLQALESALKTAEFEKHPFRPWHEDARAAIAKARGL